jgi:hypothetical protein
MKFSYDLDPVYTSLADEIILYLIWGVEYTGYLEDYLDAVEFEPPTFGVICRGR